MRTEGQKTLNRLAHKSSQWAIAHKIGVDQSIVSYWISGRYKPNYENRVALKKEFQIPLEAWDRAVEIGSV